MHRDQAILSAAKERNRDNSNQVRPACSSYTYLTVAVATFNHCSYPTAPLRKCTKRHSHCAWRPSFDHENFRLSPSCPPSDCQEPPHKAQSLFTRHQIYTPLMADGPWTAGPRKRMTYTTMTWCQTIKSRPGR
jgi:hypothetical protein